MITAKQLAQAYQCPLVRAEKWVKHINAAMNAYCIQTPLQVAHFLAQIGHESGRLVYVREIASGVDYDTGRKAAMLGNTPAADGDGQRYKGRGLIQITGKANYQAVSDALGVDFVRIPEFLEKPEFAAMSAAWFWSERKLNELADQDLLTRITQKINGGYNGINERRALLKALKKVLGIV